MHDRPRAGAFSLEGTIFVRRAEEARILPHTAAGEAPFATGTAQSVDAAKTMDRGKGDVQFLVSNRSPLPWIDGEPASCGRASKLDDGPFPSGCIVMPRLRLLKMASGPVGTFDFYISPRIDGTVEASNGGTLHGGEDT